VSKAYCLYRADSPNALWIQPLIALLLLNQPVSSAFIALANILNRALPSALLRNDIPNLHQTFDLILATLAHKVPQLHEHIASLTIPASMTEDMPQSPTTTTKRLFPMLFESLLRSILSASPSRLSLDTSARIWDIAVFEGDAALVRAAVAILARLESRLYGPARELVSELQDYGMDPMGINMANPQLNTSRLWDLGDADTFVECMWEMGKLGKS